MSEIQNPVRHVIDTLDSRTRVLWLAKGLGQGGMERLLVTHARFGNRDRFVYRAAYLVDRPHSVVDELRALDVPVTRLGSGSGSDPRWLVDLVRLVRRERIDVVHAHSPMPAALARPLLQVLSPRTRLVYTEHNSWDRYSKPTRWANMVTFPLNHRAFAVSDDCRNSVPSWLRGQIETLIHGIDVDEVASHRADRADARDELGIGDDAIVIGTVANLRLQKNYPMLLRVAAQLTAEKPNVVFLAVGQGPLEAELTSVHEELGLGERFRFLGFRADVHRVMSAFDVMCFSSNHEGLPVALMEAKALGLPVVATAVGGIPSAVTDGLDGLVVPQGDREALVGALGKLIGDAAQRAAIGREAAQTANRYEARESVGILDGSYLSAGANHQTRSNPFQPPSPKSEETDKLLP